MNTSKKWKADGEEVYFIKQDDDTWVEYSNGRVFAYFDFVKYGKSDEVIFTKGDGYYWKISSKVRLYNKNKYRKTLNSGAALSPRFEASMYCIMSFAFHVNRTNPKGLMFTKVQI